MIYTFRLTVRADKVKVTIYDEHGASISSSLPIEGEITFNSNDLDGFLQQNIGTFNDQSRKLGEALFNMLFGESIRRKFSECYEQTKLKKSRMRVDLEFEGGEPNYAIYPWEFLFVEDIFHHMRIRFAADNHLLFCRFQQSTAKPFLPKPGEYLRIALFATSGICDTGDGTPMAEVFSNTMWQNICDLLHLCQSNEQAEGFESWEVNDDDYRIKVQLYRTTTYSVLKGAIKKFQPHLVHFIGHGELREMGTLFLLDEDEAKYAAPIPADILANAFRGDGVTAPHLVILHACHGAASVKTRGFSSVASNLLSTGVMTVVGMQYAIPIGDAIDFAQKLYKLMFQLEPPLSLEAAIQSIRDEDHDLLTQPVIYTAISPSQETILFTHAYLADRIYSSLPVAEKELIPHLFSRLIHNTGKGIRLIDVHHSKLPEKLHDCVKLFSNASILALIEEQIIRLTNDTLLETWGPMETWVSDKTWRDNNHLLHQLIAYVAAWNKDKNDLLNKEQLKPFTPEWEATQCLTAEELEFLRYSRTNIRRKT
jgi:hypothetical protein